MEKVSIYTPVLLFLLSVMVSVVSFPEPRITWDIGLWECLWWIFLIILIDDDDREDLS